MDESKFVLPEFRFPSDNAIYMDYMRVLRQPSRADERAARGQRSAPVLLSSGSSMVLDVQGIQPMQSG